MLEKRRREQLREQKRKDKATRRLKREAEKRSRPAPVLGEDPDLAGMVPGPQPKLE